MEKKSIELHMKKFKLKPYKLHLFCRNLNIDFLVLLTQEKQILLYTIGGFELKVCAEVNVIFSDPIQLFSGQEGEICLLSKDCITIWTIEQLIQLKSSQIKLYFTSYASPEHAFYIGKDEFIISFQKNSLLFINKQGRSSFLKFPEIFDLKNAKVSMHSFNFEKSFLVVPTFSKFFPFIFALDQIQLWKKSDFFPKYLSIISKYYEQDEILTDRINSFCVSGNRMETYICTLKSIMQLNIRKMTPNPQYLHNYHVFSIKLVTKYTKERSSEFSSALDEKTGNLTTLGLDRIVLYNLGLYKSCGRCMIQKKSHESIVRNLSYAQDGKILLLCNGPKIFIWQQIWS